MSTANYTAEGLLILTVEQETQILNQMETAIKLMQGKITLEQAKPILGKIVYRDEDTVSFQSLFIPNKGRRYSDLDISLFGMKKEQLQEKNPPFDLYLNEASFDFTNIDGITKEKIVKLLGLQNEEYLGYYATTAYREREFFMYRYSMPKNSQTPYETSIQMVFFEEGKKSGEDRKTGRSLFKGGTELKSISISRFK